MLEKTNGDYSRGARFTLAADQPPRQEAEDDEINLLAIIGTLWRGKWIIAGCAALLLLIGGYYAFQIAVPKYRATATLTLQIQTENVVDLQSVMSGVSTDYMAINTEVEVIRSTELLGKLVDTLNLTEDPEFNAALLPEPEISLAKLKRAIRALVAPTPASQPENVAEDQDSLNAIASVRAAVSASNLRDTYIFQISATTGNPKKSQLIANTLADLYIQDQIDVKFRATENAVAWLSERVVELEADLEAREAAIKDLRARSELINAEGLQALNLQAKDVRDRLASARTNAALRGGALEDLRALQQAGDIDRLATELGDPTLTQLLGRVATEAGSRDLFLDRSALLITREEGALTRATQQVSTLESSLARLEDQIEQQSADLVQLQQLEREAVSTRTLYETFLARLKETSVQRGLQQADSRVISKATAGSYVEPRKSRILVLCIILGAMLGAGIVLARQMLHNGFRSAEDLEASTGLAVFGQIPKMPIRKRKDLIPYLHDKPTSASAEAFRNLRTSVLLSDIDRTPQVIMSTSSLPGEGKTTQSIALAHNLSGLDKKVLLIEGDIRRRTFAEYFDFGTGGGIVTALTGESPLSELLVKAPNMDVDILRGEKANVSAVDLFSSERFHDFLQEQREEYDFIVIDTPPVLVVPDARVIGQSVDAIIFTVAWDQTSKSQVSEALRQFASVGLKVQGLVMAQIDPKGMKRYGYGGRYGAYSAYGKRYYDVG